MRRKVDCAVVDKFTVRVSFAFEAFVAAKKLPVPQIETQLFFDLADQCSLGRFSSFDVAAEKIPMIGKRNIRLVIAQIDQELLLAVEQENLRDLFHVTHEEICRAEGNPRAAQNQPGIFSPRNQRGFMRGP